MITRIFIITLGIFLLLKSNKANAPRGIRNNNPLNIRDNAANNWQGKTGVDDLDFVVFDDPINGIRAAGKILISYRRRGNYTIENIINTWSPIVGKDANGNEYKNNTQNTQDFTLDYSKIKTSSYYMAHMPQQMYISSILKFSKEADKIFPSSKMIKNIYDKLDTNLVTFIKTMEGDIKTNEKIYAILLSEKDSIAYNKQTKDMIKIKMLLNSNMLINIRIKGLSIFFTLYKYGYNCAG